MRIIDTFGIHVLLCTSLPGWYNTVHACRNHCLLQAAEKQQSQLATTDLPGVLLAAWTENLLACGGRTTTSHLLFARLSMQIEALPCRTMPSMQLGATLCAAC